jgi:hypothetical protein
MYYKYYGTMYCKVLKNECMFVSPTSNRIKLPDLKTIKTKNNENTQPI